MKRLLIVLLTLVGLASFGQTSLTFTPLGSEYLGPNRGPQNWGNHPWNGITQIKYPGTNTVAKNYYIRLNWRDFESSTTQGSYTWTFFDNQVNTLIDNGAMFTVGIMAVCNGCGPGGEIPQYVQDLMTAEGKPGPVVNGDVYPNYQSTNWKARYAAAMRALANHISTTFRSGKSYTSAFLGYDIRHYSEFGEGTGFPTGGAAGQVPSTAQVTAAYMTSMIDSAIAIFPNVQLTVPMEYVVPANGADNSDYSLSQGHITTAVAYYTLMASNPYGRIGIRRDNIGDAGYNNWFTSNTATYNPGSGNVSIGDLIQNQWFYAPFGGEPSTNETGVTTTSGCSTTNLYCDFHNEVVLHHMSYFGNGNAPGGITSSSGAKWTSLVTNWTNASDEMGYDISLTGGTITTSPPSGGFFNISPIWKNAGVAPVYEGWNILYELRDPSTGTVKWRDTSDFRLRLFLPTTTDSTYVDHYTLTGVPPGTYNLHMIIKDPAGYKSPFQLSITGRQSDGSYILKSDVVVGAGCSTYAIGTPGSSVSITSMGSYNPCDVIKINTGTYTSLTLTHVTGLEITSQDVNNPVTFTRLSTFSDDSANIIHDLRWVSDLKSGNAWTQSGGKMRWNTYYNIYWRDWPSSVITKHNNIQYDYVYDSTAISHDETYHDYIVDSCGQFMQGSFGDPNSGGTTAPDVDLRLHLYNFQDMGTSLQGGNGQGTGYRGICYECAAEDGWITDRSGRGADGDVGYFYGHGGWHKTRIHKWGGPGYLSRVFPMSRRGHPWGNRTVGCTKFLGTQYGFEQMQFNGNDTIAGVTYGESSIVWSNTFGKQLNDTFNYWSSGQMGGTICPGCNWIIGDFLGFDIGNNVQRVSAGGQPNNAKRQLYENIGGHTTFGLDTNYHNYYGHDATLLKLDSTSFSYTNRTGTYYYYVLTAASPSTIVGAGLANPYMPAFIDRFGHAYNSPVDLGAFQFFGSLPPAPPSLKPKRGLRIKLRSIP